MRKNATSIVFQNSKSKKCSCSKDQKRGTLPGLRPATMAPRLRWRCIPRDQVFRYYRWISCAPTLTGGRAGARGAGGVQYNKKLNARIWLSPKRITIFLTSKKNSDFSENDKTDSDCTQNYHDLNRWFLRSVTRPGCYGVFCGLSR